MPPYLSVYAQVSTIHITLQDAERLSAIVDTPADVPITAYRKDEYGYFVYLQPRHAAGASARLRTAGFSDAFIALCKRYATAGATLLVLDRDERQSPDLPTFEWEDSPGTHPHPWRTACTPPGVRRIANTQSPTA